MKISSQVYKPKGMRRDESYSAFNPEFSWDNHNIRLTARDNNDLLSVTNENGTLELIDENLISIDGKTLGSCVVNDNLILFTHSDGIAIDESMIGLSVAVKSITKIGESISYNVVDTETPQEIGVARSCSDGYALVENNGEYSCEKTTTTLLTDSPIIGNTCYIQHFQFPDYNWYGTMFFKDGYNIDGSWSSADELLWPTIYSTTQYIENTNYVEYTTGPFINSNKNTLDGRLNKCGVWLQGSQIYSATQLGFVRTINFPESKVYYFGIGCDNYGAISIDGEDMLSMSMVENTNNFRVWNVYPKYVEAGDHEITITNTNIYAFPETPGILGLEIYTGTESELIACTTDLDLENYILFSTKSPNVLDGDIFELGTTFCQNPEYRLVKVGDSGTYVCQKIQTILDVEPPVELPQYECENPGYELINNDGDYSCVKKTKVIAYIYESVLEFSSDLNNLSESIELSFDYTDNNNKTINVNSFFSPSNDKLIFHIQSKLSASIYSIFNIRLNRLMDDITPIETSSFSWDSVGDSSWLIPENVAVYRENRIGGIDNIYRLNHFNAPQNISTKLLYSGELGFNLNNKIQTLPFYENENVQKVYWIDGVNQTRVINIMDETSIYNNTSFDFVKTLVLNETISVTKNYGGGLFKSGVIQYAFTYFNLNGSESNIFYITPINYISPIDRAGKVDEIVPNTFNININGLDDRFQYVRIYSIYRTSVDSTPELKNIVDLKISSDTISYTDTNTNGSVVSSDYLLFVGGEELISQCMSQKNNTLFLGNITNGIDQSNIPIALTNANVESNIPAHTSTFSWILSSPLEIESKSSSTIYPYLPKSLNITDPNDIIKHFKYDETYRLGIQGQFTNGRWSNPIWLGDDYRVDIRYKANYLGSSNEKSIVAEKVYGQYTMDSTLCSYLKNELKFHKIRPVMVPLKYSDRTIIAQGLTNNTLGIMKNRYGANPSLMPFAYPDYLFRTNGKKKNPSYNEYDGAYSHFDLLKLNNNLIRQYGTDPNLYIEIMANGDTWDYHDINHYGTSPNESQGSVGAMNGDFERDFFFVDRNMVNFWSPELIYNGDVVNTYMPSVSKVGLYGFAFESGASFSFKIDSGNIDKITGTHNISISNPNYNVGNLIMDSFPKRLYADIGVTGIGGGGGFNETDYPPYGHCIPIWSPANYYAYINRRKNHKSTQTDIDFTEMNKSGSKYFGVNITLSKNQSCFFDINKPLFVYNDSSTYYNSNINDYSVNSGLIIYGKNVSKSYPSNTYFNTLRSCASPWQLKYAVSPDKNPYSLEEYPSINKGMEIKYNTASHVLFSFKADNNGYFQCLPRLQNNSGDIVNELVSGQSEWYGGSRNYQTKVLSRNLYTNDLPSISNESSVNSVPIFDLYTGNPSDKDDSRYGGKERYSILGNNWISCGDPIAISSAGTVLNFTEGDTYLQRFDLLRVFPNDILQIPQHTEIISFICESFINLDGRCDVNRYNNDSSMMTPTNYGLFNSVYSQKNNYFNYDVLDPLLFNTTEFSNTIIWSKTKVAGAINDTWTNLNMLSSIDLDGVYGEVSSINLFNNDLYALQPKGVARLLFNERVQQQSSDGVSVELTNGYKVPEYRYISNQYGCNNKWSIVEGKGGIYFVDYINKSLISIGDGLKDIGSAAGFKSWFNENTLNKNYTLSYDRINSDLYIHDETNCLNYSEVLQSFVSFYDYINVPQMKNIWDSFISISYSDIKINSGQFISENNLNLLLGEDDNILISERYNLSGSTVWMNNKGEYNVFYGNQKPFSIEYLLNPEPLNDKIFNTFEYRLNDQFIDWNNLEVTNWYQYGELNDRQYLNSLKRKFNVNRVQLPRQSKTLDNSTGLINLDTRNSLNRIRSTWAKLKLSHNVTDTNINKKFDMQDLTVTYTV